LPRYSHEIGNQINRIYRGLVWTFRNPVPTTDEIERALEALELIAPLSNGDIAQESYHLFHIVMRAPISDVYSLEKKREASCLSLHGAYKCDKFLPPVGDPQDILTFLGHHFDLVTKSGQNQHELDWARRDQNQHEPIQDALHALAYAPGPVTIKALERFDPTEGSFIRGICYVYQDDKPLELRKAALSFLPLIGNRWFDTPDPIMEPDQMKNFCADWASTVDAVEHTDDVRKAILAVLFGMINSPHWRPHIVPEKWKLLEYFTLVPDDSQPLRRCIDNPELVDAISDVKNPAAMVHWLTILWFKYKELIPQVREQLEAVTKEVAQNRRTDLDTCLSVMDSELKKTKSALTPSTDSADPATVALRRKIDDLQEARASLVSFRG
jgi:hypothetical protein